MRNVVKSLRIFSMPLRREVLALTVGIGYFASRMVMPIISTNVR
jgi:hypothetical protein